MDDDEPRNLLGQTEREHRIATLKAEARKHLRNYQGAIEFAKGVGATDHGKLYDATMDELAKIDPDRPKLYRLVTPHPFKP